jgi:hypothetical protein
MKASFPDLVGEHRTETVPPEPHCPVTDVETPLEEQILDLSQRQRLADIHHHREADDVYPLSAIAAADMKTLQKFAAAHASIHNHFNHDRHLNRRDIFRQNRSAALAEWRQLAA